MAMSENESVDDVRCFRSGEHGDRAILDDDVGDGDEIGCRRYGD